MQNVRTTDQVVGAIALALSLCGALGGAIVALGGTAFAIFAGANQNGAAPTAAGLAFGFIGLVIITVYLVNLIGAVGVIGSRKWGFALSLALSAITVLISLTGADGFLGVLPNLAFAVYCYLRLSGRYGVAPT